MCARTELLSSVKNELDYALQETLKWQLRRVLPSDINPDLQVIKMMERSQKPGIFFPL